MVLEYYGNGLPVVESGTVARTLTKDPIARGGSLQLAHLKAQRRKRVARPDDDRQDNRQL